LEISSNKRFKDFEGILAEVSILREEKSTGIRSIQWLAFLKLNVFVEKKKNKSHIQKP